MWTLAASRLAERCPGPALWLMASAQFMVILDFSIVNVALPAIQRAPGFSPVGVEGVITAGLSAVGAIVTATALRPVRHAGDSNDSTGSSRPSARYSGEAITGIGRTGEVAAGPTAISGGECDPAEPWPPGAMAAAAESGAIIMPPARVLPPPARRGGDRRPGRRQALDLLGIEVSGMPRWGEEEGAV